MFLKEMFTKIVDIFECSCTLTADMKDFIRFNGICSRMNETNGNGLFEGEKKERESNEDYFVLSALTEVVFLQQMNSFR